MYLKMRGLCTMFAWYLAAVAAVPTYPVRIIGGDLTTISHYPSMAAVLISEDLKTYFQFCGGTVLSTQAILTAAHCPDGKAVERLRVRVGSNYANSGGVVHNLKSIACHPSYNPNTFDNDIAILRTATAITYVPNAVKPATVAGPNYNLTDNQEVWAVGWGRTSTSNSEQLRHVKIWAVNQATCAGRYAVDSLTVTDNMLCAGWLDVSGRGQCQGDSGGPLYHNGIVVGVTSWGKGCDLPQYPVVNTRVSKFSSWIEANK